MDSVFLLVTKWALNTAFCGRNIPYLEKLALRKYITPGYFKHLSFSLEFWTMKV